MNKAYIDLLDSKSNAVFLYIPDSYTPMANFLESKFPDGNCKETQVWAGGFKKSKGEIVIWFTGELYIYDNLVEDLQMLGYNIVELDQTFDTFDEMLEYIEENKPMTDTTIIYIQDDCRDCTTIQFCYSEDMQPIDNWIDTAYGEDKEDVFHDHWQQLTPITCTGIRNLETEKLSVEDFISMCNTLDYVVKRVNNEVTKGDSFKVSCYEAYPEDFK